jgi:hypothetical protein
MQGMAGLRQLHLDHCGDLQKVELGDCTALLVVSVRHCQELEEINLGGGLSVLKKLDISTCSNLQDVHGLKDLRVLTHMVVDDCRHLAKLDLEGLGALAELKISGWCEHLQLVTGLTGLTSLTQLQVDGTVVGAATVLDPGASGMDLLEELNLAGLVGLKELLLRGCSGLVKVDLTGISNLTKLEITACRYLGLQHVGGLRELGVLPDMNVDGWEQWRKQNEVLPEEVLSAEDQSRKLFCKHAFPEFSAAPNSWANHIAQADWAQCKIEEVLIKCEGVHVAIEAAGKYFCAATKQSKQDLLEDLGKACTNTPVGTWESKTLYGLMKLRWESLKPREQEALLDIVRFLEGQPWDMLQRHRGAKVMDELLRSGLVVQQPAGSRWPATVALDHKVADFCRSELQIQHRASPSIEVQQVRCCMFLSLWPWYNAAFVVLILNRSILTYGACACRQTTRNCQVCCSTGGVWWTTRVHSLVWNVCAWCMT